MIGPERLLHWWDQTTTESPEPDEPDEDEEPTDEVVNDPIAVIDDRIDYLNDLSPSDTTEEHRRDQRVGELKLVRDRITGDAIDE